MKKIFKFELGKKVKDQITGFTGIITGRAEYLTGCVRYLVTPKADKNNLKDSIWEDEARLKEIKIKKVRKYRSTGGPMKYDPKIN